MEHSYKEYAPQLPPQVISALQRPFSHLDILFRPGQIREKEPENTWFCLAIPYVSRQTYEARLDQVVPGAWSSTSPSIVVAGHHLTIAALVQIGPIKHTSYGETFLPTSDTPDDLTEVMINAPDAYTNAFIDACQRFGLGRYLAQLERKWVPYDSRRQAIALTHEARRDLALKLYQQAGLPLDIPATQVRPEVPHGHDDTAHARERSAPGHPREESLEEARAHGRARDLEWVRTQCAGKPLRNILQHYRLQRLEDISDSDLASISNTIHQRLRQAS